MYPLNAISICTVGGATHHIEGCAGRGEGVRLGVCSSVV